MIADPEGHGINIFGGEGQKEGGRQIAAGAVGNVMILSQNMLCEV